METIKLSFEARSDSNDLVLTIRFNDQILTAINPGSNFAAYEFDLSDELPNQVLEFDLAGKTNAHTQIDSNGNIVKDCVVEIKNVMLDEIDITQLFMEKSVYKHNFNGNSDNINDSFFGTMGCNGTVRFEFTSPFYVWLLENM